MSSWFINMKKKATEPRKTWYQDHIINPFIPIIYHKPEKEWAKDQFWKLVFTQYILGTTQVLIFNVRLQYCTYDRQNYYTIWQKNEETGPDPIFSQFWGQTSVAPNSQKNWVGTHPFKHETHCLHTQKLLHWWGCTQFFCRINGP